MTSSVFTGDVYKRQMSVKMNPELQAIQKKYKGKQDQVSMLKMQDEMKAVYAKYGTSQMGSCLPLLIQDVYKRQVT